MKLAQNPNISIITEVVLVSVAAGDSVGPGAEGVTTMFYINVPQAEIPLLTSDTYLSISVKKSEKHHMEQAQSCFQPGTGIERALNRILIPAR